MGNFMDRGAWWATVCAVAESDTTKDVCMHFHERRKRTFCKSSDPWHIWNKQAQAWGAESCDHKWSPSCVCPHPEHTQIHLCQHGSFSSPSPSPRSLHMNTGLCACMRAQSCPTLCNPMDYSPPGSCVHRIQVWKTVTVEHSACLLWMSEFL